MLPFEYIVRRRVYDVITNSVPQLRTLIYNAIDSQIGVESNWAQLFGRSGAIAVKVSVYNKVICEINRNIVIMKLYMNIAFAICGYHMVRVLNL